MLAFIGALVYICILYILVKRHLSVRGRAKLIILTILSCGIVVWPWIWMQVLQENSARKETIPSLLWPIFVLLVEIYLLKYHTFEEQSKSRKGLLSMDANALCTLTFALSSILGSHRDPCCQNLFIYGVLGCIAFVMPSPNVPSDTLDSIFIESFQKICLTYSTGMLIAGSMLLHSKSNVSKNGV